MNNLSEEEIITKFSQRINEIKKDLKSISDDGVYIEDINLCRIINYKDIPMLERNFRFI